MGFWSDLGKLAVRKQRLEAVVQKKKDKNRKRNKIAKASRRANRSR